MKNVYGEMYKYFDHRQVYNTKHYLLMVEKWKEALDKDGLGGAPLLTDLSKAFGCIKNDLLIALLAVYGFNYNSLNFIFSHLND